MQQQHHQAAVPTFETTIQVRPEFAQAPYNVVVCYELYLHDTPKTLGHSRQYVALDGNDERVRQLLRAPKQE